MQRFIHKKSEEKKGFTLIELLVVISIISILSAIIMGQLNSARAKARDIVRISDLNQIALALELYKLDNGKYPLISGVFAVSAVDNNPIWNALESDLSPYISLLPKDPIPVPTPLQVWASWPLIYTNLGYVYFPNISGSDYDLVANLEVDSNPLTCKNKNGGWKANIGTFIVAPGTSWCDTSYASSFQQFTINTDNLYSVHESN